MLRKREGFIGQKAVVLPQIIQDELCNNLLTKLLYITDIGYYPAALHHYRDRPSGSKQNILIYCIEGKGWIEISNTKRKVTKNQFFIIPAGKPHKYGSEESDPWTIHWVHFTGESAHNFVRKDFSVINLSSEENTRNDRRIRLFEEAYQTLSMGFSAENLEYSTICLWYLLGSFQYITNFERIRTIKQFDIIEKSILYMHEHINKKITLADLARHCGFSVSQFSLVFKKKTSRSPIDYYNNLRIQNACQMLDFTNLHIKEISTQLDFEDQFYFSRVFRKIMGLPPKEYRKRLKG
ncbi:MAG: AraC family transcriptional regulator [Bacteroidales bacterium]|nr:AraC family transcriptional regulator [Bacteroidales bacterium]